MIITDLKGTRYRLTKSKLITVRSSTSEWDERGFYIFLSDVVFGEVHEYGFPPGKHWSVQLWHGVSGPNYYVRVLVKGNSIGCRDFSTKTMRIIRKAIKEAKRGTKPQRHKA